MTLRRLGWRWSLAVAILSGCTYGPSETVSTVAQIVRLGDSFDAIVVVRHDVFQRPAGLSTFPDGGRWRYSARRATQYVVDALSHEVRLLAHEEAPDNLWESFGAWIVGLEGDSAVYLRLNGCPKNGECYPDLQQSAKFRLSLDGALAPIDMIPLTAKLPGVMAARRPGEVHFVRFGARADSVTVRFDEDGNDEPLFRVNSDGVLVPVGG